MFRKVLAAILRFIHEQALLLKLAEYLEQPAVEQMPEGQSNGEPTS